MIKVILTWNDGSTSSESFNNGEDFCSYLISNGKKDNKKIVCYEPVVEEDKKS